jgi:putative ATP-binding cassette transporter
MSLIHKFATFRAFARQAGALSMPYFRSEEKWKARALLAAIVVLNLAAVYMLVLINDWNRLFYDALQNKQQDVFWTQLGRFTWIAFAYIIIAVYKFYLTQLLELRWRAWLTGHYTTRWLANHAFYRMELARFTQPEGATGKGTSPDNPDQRIQEDLNLFTSYSVSLSMGLLNALVTLASFVGILWGLSGAFDFKFNGASYEIPGFMVWMAVLYCVVGSVLTHYIGRPLIPLNFQQQRVEADFRHHMVRVREYSESIALDKGEAVERNQLDGRFGQVIGNYLRLLTAQKRLTWFTNGFGQAAVVFPFIVAAPRFFSGAIQLGELMQIASAFGRVQDSLSWFVDNYDRLASWRATTDRLTSFEQAISGQIAHDPSVEWSQDATESGSPSIADLTVRLPGGEVLLAGQTLAVAPGEQILLQGPSGSGKSTLFRSLAGIWPFAQGRVRLPASSMFIPQRPYFPNGPLRDALAYPEPASRYTDEALHQALNEALLPDLVNRLDEADAWSQKLSGGEQQRLAIARVLLKQPQWVFADEASSALDPQAEQTLYQRLIELVKRTGGGLVSIAHRPSVAGFHGHSWTLVPEPPGAPARYRVQVAVTGTGPA